MHNSRLFYLPGHYTYVAIKGRQLPDLKAQLVTLSKVERPLDSRDSHFVEKLVSSIVLHRGEGKIRSRPKDGVINTIANRRVDGLQDTLSNMRSIQ